jgi:Icc-related predicted phosphoesterase
VATMFSGPLESIMLVRPFSDIHAEFWPANKIASILGMVVPPLPTDKETVALVAGDLGLAHRQETWLKVLSILAKKFLAVIYVEGNHFFYHNDFFGRIRELRTKVSLPKNVHFLENESIEINGVLFVGATLWTDFLGKDFFTMQCARKNMNDFVVIRKPNGLRLLPEDTVELFHESKNYIFDSLGNAAAKKTVVVTHHGVSPLSIHEKFRGDSLNWAFMTDISNDIIDHGPDLWVHGHTHNSFDYSLGKTRVVVNPYGYKDVEVNLQYNNNLVIEV